MRMMRDAAIHDKKETKRCVKHARQLFSDMGIKFFA